MLAGVYLFERASKCLRGFRPGAPHSPALAKVFLQLKLANGYRAKVFLSLDLRAKYSRERGYRALPASSFQPAVEVSDSALFYCATWRGNYLQQAGVREQGCWSGNGKRWSLDSCDRLN